MSCAALITQTHIFLQYVVQPMSQGRVPQTFYSGNFFVSEKSYRKLNATKTM
jgi:hypothetical protein